MINATIDSCVVVKDLENLFGKYLDNKKVIKDVKIVRISEVGDNYGGIIYAMDLTLQSKDLRNEEVLRTITKTLPEGENSRKIMQVQLTYNSEMTFYEVMHPTIVDFQKELGIPKSIDCFAKCYAVRRNLSGDPKYIDDDAVIVLENLKILGFSNIEKAKGFDKETTEVILKMFAKFHGVTLALKMKKPEVFERCIKKHCHAFKTEAIFMPEVLPLIVNENEETRKIMAGINGWLEAKRQTPREPFATICHDDAWPNNIMIRYENGHPVESKLIDFQVYTYGSPAIDLFFFLWTSVSFDALRNNIDHYVKFYHDHLIAVLKEHGVDTKPFSFDTFMEDMEFVAPFQFVHALLFYCVIVSPRKGDVDFDKMPTPQQVFACTIDRVREKVYYMIKECHRRKWIK